MYFIYMYRFFFYDEIMVKCFTIEIILILAILKYSSNWSQCFLMAYYSQVQLKKVQIWFKPIDIAVATAVSQLKWAAI